MNLLVAGFHWLASHGRNLWYRLLGVHLEGYCWLRAIEVSGFRNCIWLGKGVALDRGVILQITCPPRSQVPFCKSARAPT